MKMLHIAYPSGRVGMALCHSVPEMLCKSHMLFRRTQKFRYRRVRMMPGQHIRLIGNHSLHQLRIIKNLRCPAVLLLAALVIELVQAVVHASVLLAENHLARLLCPSAGSLFYPVTQFFRHSQGLFTATQTVYRQQSVQDLMHRIPGNPGYQIPFQRKLPLFNIKLPLRFFSLFKPGPK